MKSTISSVRGDGFERIVMFNEVMRVVIVPDLGGKIISLANVRTGREFLLQHPDRPFRRANYGDSFGDYDISGFDECLPTIALCSYPEAPFAGTSLPDHGEIWSLPWESEIRGEHLITEVSGVRLPYRLRRNAHLSDSALELQYEITNTSARKFKYLWSAHPSFTVQRGTEIVVPAGVSEVLVDYSANHHLTKGKLNHWPQARTISGHTSMLNMISGPEAKTADKLFTDRLSEGFCGLRFPHGNEAIYLRFDPQLVPFLGIWICQGGFPAEGPAEYTVALEPCSGRPDSLVAAIDRGECPELEAQASHRWWLRLEIQ